MNWADDCAYAPDRKQRFHSSARTRLRRLARELGFATDSYDLRSNPGGEAVSGEVTLHHDAIYIQVSQPCMGGNTGVLIRTCRGRRDHTGGQNTFASLDLLDDPPALAGRVRAVMGRG